MIQIKKVDHFVIDIKDSSSYTPSQPKQVLFKKHGRHLKMLPYV